MGRRGRLATAVLAAAALLAAVLALRSTTGAGLPSGPWPAQPTPLSAVVPFTAGSVTVPPLPGPPGPVRGLHASPGDGHVLLTWAPPSGGFTGGYEVRWDTPGRSSLVRLVAGAEVDMPGLDDGVGYSVQVRAVDGFGRRGVAVAVAVRPTAAAEAGWRAGLTGFLDDLDSPDDLARTRWRVPSATDRCLGRGTGPEVGYLLVRHGCGPVELRPAVPLVLATPGVDGIRGRFVVAVDGPPRCGAVLLALVPGPVSGLPPSPGASQPPAPAAGSVTVDPTLPPGTVVLRLSDGPGLSDGPDFLVGPGTADGPALLLGPRTFPPSPGVPHRWELAVAARRVLALRDGVPVLALPARLGWTSATAVVDVAPGVLGVLGAPGAPDAGVSRVDLVGLSGPPSSPGLVRVLPVGVSTVGSDEAGRRVTRLGAPDLPGLEDAESLRFLAWARPVAAALPAVRIGPVSAPLRPATPGQPVVAGSVLPVVADLPALDDVPGPHTLEVDDGVNVVGTAAMEVSVRSVVAARPQLTRLPRLDPPPAPTPQPAVQILSTDGHLLPGPELPRGRLVLDVVLDGAPSVAAAGEVGGCAGMTLTLDQAPLLALPTAADGPSAGGEYRIGLDTRGLPAGTHTLTLRVMPVEPGVPPALVRLPVVLPV